VSVVKWTIPLAVMAICASPAMAQSSLQTAFSYNLDEAAPVVAPAEEAVADDAASSSDGCGCGEETGCGCEPSCGCDSGCCDGGGFGNCLGDCCLGDAWTLSSCLTPNCCDGPTYGGWMSWGYLTDNDRLSVAPNDLLSFEDNPDRLNLNQAWLYVEKLADASSCDVTWGYRADVVYGVDAQKTQAFGNPGGTWDVTFDDGSYGWAIPQAYGELGWNDWSVKFGHFFTPVGYEVIPVTGNFFYSHAYTMFNSEPFTHTGILATNTASDTVTWYAGWTLGWDTGFDQNQGGSNFLGGVGLQLNDDVKYTYICTAGNLGFKGEGYSHSNVVDFTLSENWHYVLQSDYVNTNLAVPVTGNDLQDVGVNQYLFYTLNDCWALGGRAEWWKSNGVAYGNGESASYQEITGGLNYKPHANVVVRPEIRYNWTNESAGNGTLGFNNTVFGVDAVFTF
jgi:Putative beta-barrel porin-2, OmpL-like. bbp2